MRTFILFIITLTVILSGCEKKKRKTSGKISVDLFVYNDPTGDIYNSFHIPISTLYFIKDEFIEELPIYADTALNHHPFVYIKKDGYAFMSSLSDKNSPDLMFLPLKEKNTGVKFIGDTIPHYKERVAMTDTAFNGFNYKRVRIATKDAFTVFYIHQTDTILPFSLAPQFDKDYKGVLNRIDTYEIEANRFTSLRLSVSDTIPQKFYEALKAN